MTCVDNQWVGEGANCSDRKGDGGDTRYADDAHLGVVRFPLGENGEAVIFESSTYTVQHDEVRQSQTVSILLVVRVTGVFLVVAIGVALGVFLGGILLTLVAYYMKRLFTM